jgi:hypothetical protein
MGSLFTILISQKFTISHQKEETMLNSKWVAALVLLVFAVQPAFADDRAKILGTWKLIAYEAEIQSTGERTPALGKNPTGYAIFTAEGRFMSVITGDGRKAAKTDQDRAELLKSMFAYTGMYRLEGDKIITKVDVSWTPLWVGTEQTRFFRFDGERLQVISAWGEWPRIKGLVRGFLTFERAK